MERNNLQKRSISLKSPIWEITIPEKGKELKDYYNIPEGDIGQYAFIAECDSQLLSPSAIRINDKTFKAVVELANVMTWLPYIHNGYFYISDPRQARCLKNTTFMPFLIQKNFLS